MIKLPTGNAPSSRLEAVTVGTGTSAVRLDRRGPCTLVSDGETRIAVDLGCGSLRGLLRAGVSHEALDALLLTHLHPDHLADLLSLLFAANYEDPPRKRPLLLAGGEGLLDYVGKLRAAHGHWLEPKRYALEVRELSPGEGASVGAIRFTAGTSLHIASSLAYRFHADGRSLAVAGDTGPCAELEQFARGVDVLILEASLPQGQPSAGHLTPEQAGSLARSAGARRLVLHHLTPASDACSPEREAAEAFGLPVVAARDGLRIRI